MKNETSVLDEILEKIKNIDSKEFVEYLENIFKEERQNIEYVGHKEYFNCLINKFLLKFPNKIYDNEDFSYMDKGIFSNIDIENESKIYYVGDFLTLVRKKQRAQKDEEYSFPFEGTKLCFKFNNKMYVYFLMVGQGTSITIREANEDEIFKRNINLDKYFREKGE